MKHTIITASKTPTVRHRRAFTLLEIMVAFFIGSLVIGLVVLSIDSVTDEKRLRTATRELNMMAADAMRKAISEQRSYSIFVNQNILMLRETHIRQEDIETFYKEQNDRIEEQKQATSTGSLFDDEEIAAPRQRVVSRFDLEPDMSIQWKRWVEREYTIPKGIEWVFEASGICEPVSVRISSDDGYIEMDYNPLTAKPQDERMYIAPSE
jgi:type II secretory pathway pseudopilin PulG